MLFILYLFVPDSMETYVSQDKFMEGRSCIARPINVVHRNGCAVSSQLHNAASLLIFYDGQG